jgi:putative ABC transport system permease protein
MLTLRSLAASLSTMATTLMELRLAVRSLLKAPAFAAAAVATLGLALTLCTTVMVVINAYLYTQLPYPNAARLYSVRYSVPGQQQPREMEQLDWSSLGDVLEEPIAWDLDMFYLLGGDNAESVPGAWVTPGFVRGLGAQPAFGRGFDDAAFAPGSANVAIISHRLWHSRFGGDRSVIGREFTAYVSDRPEEAEAFTIIGVLPANFWHVNPYTDIFAPLRARTYPYMVRLREGVTPEQAAGRITALVRDGATGVPPEWTAGVASTHDLYTARVRPILRSVAAAAALVLLVGCANVAGLLLLRASRRQKEIAVRTALGASVGGIARMLVAEALVLGGVATGAALLATRLLLSSVAPMIQRQLGRSAPGGEMSFAIDPTVLIVASVAGLLTALVCGLAPLATALRPSLAGALQSGTRTSTESRRSRRVRAALIGLEIAASLALLSGSTLMLRTVVSLLRVDLGFESDRALIAAITLRQSRYPAAPDRLALYERTVARVGEIGGVESVALMSSWPMQQPRVEPIAAEGPSGRVTAQAGVHAVTAEYFSTLGIPLSAGRVFHRSDRLGGEPVAIVSETMAARFWPAGRAIGGRLLVPQDVEQGDPVETSRVIVGVVRDVRQDPADEDLADVYVPLLQVPERFAVAIVRTSGSPGGWLAPLKSAFRDIDPEIPLTGARPLPEVVGEIRSRPQFLAWLLIAFATIAAFVAIVGVYGMMAYGVGQREREIAVRIAIGASPRQVTRVFVREGAIVVAAGLALGIAAAFATGRLLESQLFGVRPGDPLALATAVAALGAAGVAAVWWPSRRAAATDPAIALRNE